MANPFPGMNPYLEHPGVFHGFHHDLCTAINWAIGAKLPTAYFASSNTSLYLHEFCEQDRTFGHPAVAITRSRQPQFESSARGQAVAMLAPRRSEYVVAADEIEVPFVEVRTVDGHKLVTVIEVLSLTNKSVRGNREAYLVKRHRRLRSSSHFVEIDLLRAGEPMPLRFPIGGDYRVIVSRHEERPNVDGWPVSIRDRLPTIPIPLLGADADVPLDLQTSVNDVYIAGGYARRIYDDEPLPPLSPEHHSWASRLVESLGRPRPE